MNPSNLVDILRAHAEHQPDAGAIAFLTDGETVGPRLSFAELDVHARALGATLQQLTRPGDRALLIYEPGLEFVVAFLGCQYAGITAIPAPPPDDRRAAATLARVRGIIGDARPAIVLTTAGRIAAMRGAMNDQPGCAALRWQATDQLELARAALWTPPSLADDDLSFLQYTSGSTSMPKGVMVSHRNLMVNLAMIAEATGEARNVVSWLPVFHDMGLIGNLLYGVYRGTETHLMSPLSFLKRPLRWLQAISGRERVVSGAPNFAYETVLRRLGPGDKQGLDLSGWTTAFCGAETVRAGTMARFVETFAECGFDERALVPCYGLAEATLIVSARTPGRRYQVHHCDKHQLEQGVVEPPRSETASVVSCGSSRLDQVMAIVDPETHAPCPDGRVGEIWIGGEHVAQGYFDDPERTAQTFAAVTTAGEGPFLRTGDLGFIIAGELHVTGRIKEIIIVRGRCLYPQDLELMVESMADEFPELCPGQTAAFALIDDARETIGLIVKVARRKNPQFDAARLIEAIQARALAQFEVGFQDIALVRSSIPKTSSGKTMRTLCAAQMGDEQGDTLGEFRVLHRWRRIPEPSAVERASVSARPELARLVVEWIAREEGIEPDRISTATPFTELGLDSVAAVSLLDYLEETCDMTISASIFEQHRTIDALVDHLG